MKFSWISSGFKTGLSVSLSEVSPINAVKSAVDEFVSTGKISRPFLGVSYKLVTRDLSVLNEIPQGAYIQDVVPGSAAEDAKIKAGDIITKIDGQAFSEQNKLSDIIAAKKVGDKINLEVWTEGKTRQVEATLKEIPS